MQNIVCSFFYSDLSLAPIFFSILINERELHRSLVHTRLKAENPQLRDSQLSYHPEKSNCIPPQINRKIVRNSLIEGRNRYVYKFWYSRSILLCVNHLGRETLK